MLHKLFSDISCNPERAHMRTHQSGYVDKNRENRRQYSRPAVSCDILRPCEVWGNFQSVSYTHLIILSKEGEDFLGYARQVLEQAAILEDKYKGGDGGKKQFCVSTQHYSFAVNAFVDLIRCV